MTRTSSSLFAPSTLPTVKLYRVALFTAQDRVFVLEAGGARDAVERTAAHIDWEIATFRARCGFSLAPVLASRTCNRW